MLAWNHNGCLEVLMQVFAESRWNAVQPVDIR